ncbi:hypothetical protein BT67DRAFT_240486 [Trichocladium antarcticum]|uniref:Secreted protein n=1 Tax=Trichocladium antarcticum TaxID=1450529 RepID=A0AAN6UCL9_9PEZI|nr:hypothetical protein BT67DRAFT_240486 [Trichocladium antarcticum]
MFTSLTLRPSLLHSLLAILFPRLWTRKGDGTPPTLRATALRLLAFGKHPYPPFTLARSCSSHKAEVSTTPSSTEAASEIRDPRPAQRVCVNAFQDRNRTRLRLPQQPPASGGNETVSTTRTRRLATRNRISESSPIPLICRFGNCELHPTAAGAIRLGKRSL